MSKVETTEINPTKMYSKYEILLLGILGKTEPTVRKKILDDKTGKNLLKTEVEGVGTAKRYKILGANIIKYLKERK